MDILRAILLLIVLGLNSLFSQQLNYKNLTTKDGLPSNEVYDMAQDIYGYMWFATDKGLAKYDGYEFTSFSHDSLPEGSILRIQADKDGKIWYFPNNKQFGYILNNEVYPSKDFHLLNKHFKKNEAEYFSYYITRVITDSSGGRWYNINKNAIINITKNKELKCSIKPFNKRHTLNAFKILNVEGQLLTQVDWSEHNPQEYFLSFYNNDWQLTNYININPTTIHNGYKVDPVKWKNNLYFSSGPVIYEFNEKSNILKEYPFPESGQRPISMCVSPNNQLVISTLNDGIYIYNHLAKKHKEFRNYFSGETISEVIFDHQNNMWASSISNGVYFISNYNFTKYKTGKINSISTGNKLYLASQSGKVYNYDNKTLLQYNYNNKAYPVRNIKQNENDVYILDDFNLYKNKVKIVDHIISGKSIEVFDARNIYLGQKNTLYFFSDKKLTSETIELNFNVAHPKICETEEIKFRKRLSGNLYKLTNFNTTYNYKNKLLTGGKNGMYILTNDSLNKLNNFYINQIKHHKSKLILATQDEGIQMLDSNFQILNSNFINQHLTCNQVNCILMDKDTIWAGTACGLYKFHYSNSEVSLLEKFNLKNGLPTNDITALALFNDELIIGTPEGLMVTDKFIKQKESSDIPIHFNSITCNENELPNYKPATFAHDSNYFEFKYKAINFSQEKTEYEYKLKGLEDNWIRTTQTRLRFANLNPGKYTFSIHAVSPKSVTKSYSFLITPPYWETWWFYTLIATGILLIIYWYINRLQEKNKLLLEAANLKENELDLRQKTLTAQINPHFFFNVLASIQSFYIKNDIKSGNEYMSKFSRIMRLILYSSTDSFLLVEEEIELLENYMSLEQIRAKNRFEFSIDVHPVLIEEEYKLPSMMLQPFIENAIKHGISDQLDGIVKISFKLVNQEAVDVNIEDNGIGRKAAKAKNQIKDGLHRSKGLGIIKDRLKLMNKNKEDNFSIKITDKENPTGTLVQITLPIK